MIKALIAVIVASIGCISLGTKKDRTSPRRYNVNIYYDTTNYAKSKDTICYKPNTKVTWSDFKGKPQPVNNIAAISSVGFGYGANIKSSESGIDININVSTFFIRSKSWHIPNVTDHMLTHEQNHVDIGRIGADLFIKNLKKRTITKENFDAQLDAAYKESWAEYRALQKLFDSESDHGLIPSQQAAWVNKVQALLSAVTY